MEYEFKGLHEMARKFASATKRNPGRTQKALDDIGKDFFKACIESTDYDDDEGTLRGSFRPGAKDRIEERNGDTLTVGTKVYYAVMVEEGHVIGVRAKGHSHKKGGRAKDTYNVYKGFAPGRFFMQKAFDSVQSEMEKRANELFDEIGKELGL